MRYEARIGGQPEDDVLLIQLRTVEDRPVVRLHLTDPVNVRELFNRESFDPCGDVTIVSEDPVGEHMSGYVEL